jgi:hypothetical protein
MSCLRQRLCTPAVMSANPGRQATWFAAVAIGRMLDCDTADTATSAGLLPNNTTKHTQLLRHSHLASRALRCP